MRHSLIAGFKGVVHQRAANCETASLLPIHGLLASAHCVSQAHVTTGKFYNWRYLPLVHDRHCQNEYSHRWERWVHGQDRA
ncbi:hypothetical protein BDQ94DRAFT_150793 [Aspergillus welwitschiae]|uniref:Uncharacterized protein n=1 Tax=Aspergillus welwitschiae TaxID=1341132 RepID=A0A3F3PQI6_9EURO|nr:hypothetical protein BDQ94DRAFT_150793 [Aspergillus welwitschiae]RDH29195.1 hypothetical protein BDQ94DRAFT_150793 [Aspergillus welwitschiae]